MTSWLDSVARSRPLPVGRARGRVVVPADVLRETGDALRGFRGTDGPHEGMVLWAGRQQGCDALIEFLVRPACDHGWGHVRADEAAILAATREARARRAAVLVQVHSHPGTDTRHSDGDDRLVLMPFEGMFSLVVARYGLGTNSPVTGVGVHQFQDGRWTRVEAGALVVRDSEVPI